MPILKYIERIRYMDSLIRKKGTGTLKQLAAKLHLSERTTLLHLKAMKELGCPIKYCRKRNCYYYNGEGKVVISFFDKRINDGENSGGGKNCFMNLSLRKPNRGNTAVRVYNLALYFEIAYNLIFSKLAYIITLWIITTQKET